MKSVATVSLVKENLLEFPPSTLVIEILDSISELNEKQAVAVLVRRKVEGFSVEACLSRIQNDSKEIAIPGFVTVFDDLLLFENRYGEIVHIYNQNECRIAQVLGTTNSEADAPTVKLIDMQIHRYDTIKRRKYARNTRKNTKAKRENSRNRQTNESRKVS